MRRIVLAAATIIGLTVPVLGQSATMVQIPSLGGRTLFVVKPPTEKAIRTNRIDNTIDLRFID